MKTENPVRLSTRLILEKAEYVKINPAAVEKLADQWVAEKITAPCWPREMHLVSNDPKALLTYVIVLDSLNFCFWHPSNQKWSIFRDNVIYDGYEALALVLKDFFKEHPEQANFRYFAKMPFSDFRKIMQGGRRLLFLKTRWRILQKVSEYFLKNYQGNPVLFVQSAKNQLSLLIPKVAADLPSFNDARRYQGNWVYFCKRAQILSLDIYGAFNGQGVGYFRDLEYATAFADYQLPRILQNYGILQYRYVLEEIILEKRVIPVRSPAEIEIRSATIWAVEYLREALERRGFSLHSFQIDWLLWNQSQKTRTQLPHHRTRTIYY